MGLTATKELPIVQLKLDQVNIEGGTQARAEINHTTVSEYAEHLDDLPPVDVFFDGVKYWLAEGFHRWHAHKKKGRATIACRKHLGTVRAAILFAVGANAENALQLTDADRRHACRMLLTDSEWGKWSKEEIARQCRVSPWLVADEKKRIKEEKEEQRKKEEAAAERAVEKARQEAEAKAKADRDKTKEGWVRPGKKTETPVQATRLSHSELPQSEESEPEEEVCTYRTKHGTIAQMKTGKIGKGRSRHIIRVEKDPDVLKEIDKQIPRSFKKAARQGIRRGWSEDQGVEYLRKMWRSLLAGEG